MSYLFGTHRECEVWYQSRVKYIESDVQREVQVKCLNEKAEGTYRIKKNSWIYTNGGQIDFDAIQSF